MGGLPKEEWYFVCFSQAKKEKNECVSKKKKKFHVNECHS